MSTNEMNETMTATIATEENTNPEIENPDELYTADYYTDECYNLFKELRVEGNYTKSGIKANVTDWLNNKRYLINLLRKHPNWDEKNKCVVFKTTERRENNKAVIRQAYFKLFDACYDYICPEFDLTDLQYHLKHYCASQYIEEEGIGFFNTRMPDLHIKVGQKTSRVVNKIYKFLKGNEAPDFEKYFAILADSLNPLTVDRTSVLSVNFMDYMTMSNGNSWSSCHGITPNANYGGCYKAGCLSYANDAETLIFYTIEKGVSDRHFAEKKITRQVFFWDRPVLVQERLYPQCNDGLSGTDTNSPIRQYRELVESVFALCYEVPNLWSKTSIDIYRRDDTFMYEDWDNYSYWVRKFSSEEANSDMFVGSDSYCLECGCMKYSSDEDCCETLYCESCNNDEVTCYECGCVIDEEDARLINGEYYCDDCYFYCEYHNCYEPINDRGAYVENYGDVCDYALNYSDRFFYCESCENWYQIENTNINYVDGEAWCDDCISEYAYYCKGCEEYHSNDKAHYHTINGDAYCASYARENNMIATCNCCGDEVFMGYEIDTDVEFYCAVCAEEIENSEPEYSECDETVQVSA